MKKLVATLSLAALATGAFAQGFVNIGNTLSTAAMYTQTGTNPPVKTGTAASGFFYDVLVNASTVTTIDGSLQGLAAAGWSDSGITGVNGTGGLGSGRILPGVSSSTLWAAGTEMSAVVIGWNSSVGTTLASALAAINGSTLNRAAGGWSGGALQVGQFVGFTTLALAVAGPDAGTSAALFGTGSTAGVPTPINTPTTLFTAVPEPGTMALAGLGVASLMIFRRRK